MTHGPGGLRVQARTGPVLRTQARTGRPLSLTTHSLHSCGESQRALCTSSGDITYARKLRKEARNAARSFAAGSRRVPIAPQVEMFLGTRSKTPPEQLRCDSKRETIYTTPSLRPRARLSRTPTSSTEPELHAQPRGDSRRPSLGGRDLGCVGGWYSGGGARSTGTPKFLGWESAVGSAEMSRNATCDMERGSLRVWLRARAPPPLIPLPSSPPGPITPPCARARPTTPPPPRRERRKKGHFRRHPR